MEKKNRMNRRKEVEDYKKQKKEGKQVTEEYSEKELFHEYASGISKKRENKEK